MNFLLLRLILRQLQQKDVVRMIGNSGGREWNLKDKKCFLIQPPNNEYSKKNTAIHGISSKHTR